MQTSQNSSQKSSNQDHFVRGQGQHLDPLDPNVPKPNPASFTARQRAAVSSRSMQVFRGALASPQQPDLRAAVLEDLSQFYGYSPEECLERCIHWEQWSVREWKQKSRGTPGEIADFYRTTESWSFDLLWYAYLQAEQYAYPVSVAIAESLAQRGSPGEHLDFGSGVGVTGQLFSRLGYRSSLADVSTTLQAFARFRLQKRDDRVTYIDLNQSTLEPGRYDVITAIDTLAHIPDVEQVMATLYRALRPGGVLFANFDTRPPADENAWHLYSDDRDLRFQLHRCGFEEGESIDLMSRRYDRVETRGVRHAARGVRDLVLFKSPLRPAIRAARSRLRSLVQRVAG